MAPTAEQLLKSNVRVEKRPGITQRVVPVNRLNGSIKRFLPPPGGYFDQSTLDKASAAFNADEKCIFCWHPKEGDKDCKCDQKCLVCKSNNHPGRQCPRVYAGVQWWRARGHRPRKQAQIRPNPAERAYLVVAGVFRDWKMMEEPVVVNMKHPFVRDFYRGKKAPSAGKFLPKALRSSPATAVIGSRAISSASEPDADEADPTTDLDVSITLQSTPVQQYDVGDTVHDPDTEIGMADMASDTIGHTQGEPGCVEQNVSFLDDLLEDTWRPASYHEGTRYATVTPLSLRLAITTAQQFSTFQRPTASTGNEVRHDLDPRLEARTHSEHTACTHRHFQHKTYLVGMC